MNEHDDVLVTLVLARTSIEMNEDGLLVIRQAVGLVDTPAAREERRRRYGLASDDRGRLLTELPTHLWVVGEI